MFVPSAAQQHRRRRVVGIDPGLTRCGYAVIEGSHNAAVSLSLGVIRTSATDDLADRLLALRDDIAELLDEFTPDVVAIERVFFQANVRTAMSVGQASGIALVEARARGCQVVQYTPNQIKETVAGYGAADKAQIQKMVKLRLGLATTPRPADAADAAAIALCHLAVEPVHMVLR